jgi:hypothetical protein
MITLSQTSHIYSLIIHQYVAAPGTVNFLATWFVASQLYTNSFFAMYVSCSLSAAELVHQTSVAKPLLHQQVKLQILLPRPKGAGTPQELCACD